MTGREADASFGLQSSALVMDAGQVRALGTHAELVAGDPLYAELAATQFLATAT
jgi:ATP-binding cassette subfamily C protein